jgi:hypothetical protein
LLPLDKTNAISGVYQEEAMKISTIAIVTLFALASTAYASATSHKHRHHHTAKMNATSGMTTGMARSGPSGPSLDGGGVDKSRPGGQGVSRKQGD